MKSILRTIALTVFLTLLMLYNTGCGSQLDTLISSDRDFSFIYMSDSQSDPAKKDYSYWGKLLKAAAAGENKPAFIMLGGDLVNDSGDKKEWNAFLKAGGENFKTLKVYPAVGNHDRSEQIKTRFDLPANGPAGKKETFYSFDYENAHFTVLDSNDMGAADPSDIAWLRKDLTATNKDYKIVMFHHPAYPVNNNPKDMDRARIIQESFVPVMEEAGVDLVLSGHQHSYMRTYPLMDGERDEKGIVYLMGNSGGKFYKSAAFDYAACTIPDKPVYSKIFVDEKGISIETRDINGRVLDSTRGPDLTQHQRELSIVVKGDGIKGQRKLQFQEFSGRPDTGFQHVYSTVNNWPSSRFYAARGIKVRSILMAAGVLDAAQVITFGSSDGYKVSFTREQLLEPRFYFPMVVGGSDKRAEPVEPIIAYEYLEGSADMKAVQDNRPCLIFGQRNPLEHTNIAFVVDVKEIIVSNKPAGAWQAPATFPKPGPIAAGESVKLQHKYYGLVKLHYTTDGTDPTALSPMYNPSTYQPELNVPITIKKDVVIKAMATGYGKKDSKISSFKFNVQ